MKQNGGHFEFCMILISGHFKTPSNRLSTLKKPHTRHFDQPNWPTGAKDIYIHVGFSEWLPAAILKIVFLSCYHDPACLPNFILLLGWSPKRILIET